MIEVCTNSYFYALEAYETRSREKALLVIEEETKADALEISMRASHIKRLTKNQCTTEAGIVYLDALVCLERIPTMQEILQKKCLKKQNKESLNQSKENSVLKKRTAVLFLCGKDSEKQEVFKVNKKLKIL